MSRICDVAIVGAGPAGLQAAIYAASEGLSTIVVCDHLGGAFSHSASIENLFGVTPNTISGKELAERAVDEAKRFGVQFIEGRATSLESGPVYRVVHMADQEYAIGAKAVVVGTGLSFARHPALPDDPRVIYNADMAECEKYRGKRVAVIGGANSAGQAAVCLAQHGARTHMIVRSTLDKDMSTYLIDEINKQPINVLEHTTIAKGYAWNAGIVLEMQRGEPDWVEHADFDAVLCYIGSVPETAWLAASGIVCDEKGFIKTDASLQTNLPGVFAVGDVRAGSMKRIAAAMGDGANVIAAVHALLGEVKK